VIPTLEEWKSLGKTLVIFSSGSVQAQLQFFSVVEDGSTTRDLKPLFAAHFDPTIAGSKLENSSYSKICKELGQDAASVTFLTDNIKGTSNNFPFTYQLNLASSSVVILYACLLHPGHYT
jgi:enolase-phosphatase E1